MFHSDVYTERRKKLHGLVKSGIAVFIGNSEASMNYGANVYPFRQDSDFLYFFGIDLPGFAGLMDFDQGNDIIFGNDFGIDDVIWMGPQPKVRDLALSCGIKVTALFAELANEIGKAKEKGRKIHFLPPYRGETKIVLGSLLASDPATVAGLASTDLARAVISMRSVKEEIEIDQIEKAVDISCEMHIKAMKMCKSGVSESDIFGAMQGIAFSRGAMPSFPYIISTRGHILHNPYHNNILREGQLMVNDSGVETDLHYTSDITRTTPVNGKFNSMQKEIYETVLKANTETIKLAKPGVSNRELHLKAANIIAECLKDIGLMKNDTAEAVALGAHALFFPHGLGHLLGLDAHDMEALGEEFIGYDETVKRSQQFGFAYLRFAKKFVPGHVFTIEPGCYFIPELISLWKSGDRFSDFINYDKLEAYSDFGGVRIEDNILITERGSRVLGKPIPKTVVEIEAVCL